MENIKFICRKAWFALCFSIVWILPQNSTATIRLTADIESDCSTRHVPQMNKVRRWCSENAHNACQAAYGTDAKSMGNYRYADCGIEDWWFAQFKKYKLWCTVTCENPPSPPSGSPGTMIADGST